jgi:hypothetical protein
MNFLPLLYVSVILSDSFERQLVHEVYLVRGSDGNQQLDVDRIYLPPPQEKIWQPTKPFHFLASLPYTYVSSETFDALIVVGMNRVIGLVGMCFIQFSESSFFFGYDSLIISFKFLIIQLQALYPGPAPPLAPAARILTSSVSS